MRRRGTGRQPRLTLVRGGDGVEDNGSASTIYGPVRAGLTIPRTTQSQALTESLNELERQVETLESKSSEVLDTLSTVLERLAVLLPFITSTTIIDKEKESN